MTGESWIRLAPLSLDSLRSHGHRASELSTVQSTEERAFAANKYGSKKDKGYNSTIKKKDLPYGYMSLTFGTFGSFGEGTWRLITKACDPRYLSQRHMPVTPWLGRRSWAPVLPR